MAISKIKVGSTEHELEATKLVNVRSIDGMSFDGTDNVVRYATCATAAATVAKTASVTDGTFTLSTGSRVTVKFTYANSAASPTLNINSTGAKAIYWHGAALASSQYWQAGAVLDFVYNGTQWELVGVAKDNNTTYSAAGSSLGLVKTGGDVTISSGVITVNDDSHNHTIANVDNLQTTLDTINEEIDGSIKGLSVSGKTITYTKNDGTTGTITTQDTNTDVNVKQTSSTTSNYRALLMGTSHNATPGNLGTEETGQVYKSTSIVACPSTGEIKATTFTGALSGNATTATSATKATKDASGNTITSTYETKTDATSKLAEAKSYADSAAATVKDDLLNGAGTAYDTLKELGDLIDDNQDAIDALETVAAGKANASHTHGNITNAGAIGTASGKAVITTTNGVLTTGTVPVASGGTGATTAAGALTNLGITATAAELNKMDGVTATASEINKLDGLTATTTELNYVDGVTSNIQTQLNGKAKGESKSATTAATAGWYRIATSAAGISRCIGTFEIEATVSGKHSTAIITASSNYGVAASSTVQVLHCSHYSTAAITKARIVYHTTYSSNYAYVEVYNPNATAIPITVKLIGGSGWSLVAPSTAGSVPSGYASKEVTLSNGTIVAGTFSGALSGNATTASSAAKLTGLTASRALVSDSSGNATVSAVTSTELGYLDGVTSAIQTQLNGKAASSHGNHVPTTETANNAKFLRNDNTWQTVTPANIGAATSGHTHSSYVNQNAFSNVAVGSTTIAADSTTDTLTLVAGSNVTLTPDATNDKITIAATDTVYTHPSYTARTGKPTANATPAFGGTFTVSQITSDATGHVTAATDRTITIPSATATTSAAGLMSAADKTKLNGIATGATANTGTITGVSANGTSVATSGVANIPAASTSAYGVTKLSSSTSSTSTSLAATPSAVKVAYDLAAGKADATHYHNSTEIITASSSDGVAYTATVPSITALTAGVSFIMVPGVVSASTAPTLNVNGLGAKTIRRRLSSLATGVQAGYTSTWLAVNYPFRVVYDGTQWIAEGQNKPASADLYGAVAIAKGGTGATTAEAARTNLEVYSKTEVDAALANVGGGSSDAMPKSGGAFTGTVTASSTTSYDGQIRNIHIALSGDDFPEGNEGDILLIFSFAV